MELGRSGGVQGDRTDRTNTQTQIVTRFGLTWHQKVNFSKILEFQCTRNFIKTFHFVPGVSRTPLLFIPRYLTNIIFRKYFQEKKKNGNRKSENLKICKFENLNLKLKDLFSPHPPHPTPPLPTPIPIPTHA